MYGKSYDGVTGLIGIAQQPKGLAAVVAQEPVYDLYRYLYSQPRALRELVRDADAVRRDRRHAGDDRGHARLQRQRASTRRTAWR